ncbi:hypothetical protein JW899_02885 [Candidatus Uhrbacteria bacterium]|nr:hypothetical protein [Candidatus Uhrbacteria bacterium]
MLGRKHREKIAAVTADGPGHRIGWLLAAVLLLASAAAWPEAAMAQTSAADQLAAGLESTQTIGLGTADLVTMVGRIINVALGILGVIVVVLFVYAGYVYMMAKGDSGEVDKAKRIMVSTVIGLVIVLSAYAITQFILRTILGSVGPGGGQSGSGGSVLMSNYCTDCGPEQLGNGIISYHYPTVNQTDVERNTGIAITFKLPLLPSSVLKNYFDNGTYDTADDGWCPTDCSAEGHNPIDPANPPTFYLNDDNVKVVPFADLQTPSGSAGSAEAFESRYDTDAVLSGGEATAVLTAVSPVFDVNGLGQTLVIMPTEFLGSSQADVNYRVALRGGSDEGAIRVFAWDPDSGAPVSRPAFDRLNPDGSYFWNFTTGTLLDLTPPEITAVVPKTAKNLPVDGDDSGRLFRNQLLQVYFSKPMNPATVSGINGSGFGFIETYYRDGASWKVLPGTWVVAAGYRAVEYVPDMPCDGITENSCGDKVFCLPSDTLIAVAVKPASVGEQPPRAAALNGVVDMVGNVLDGNADGELLGPGPVGIGSWTMNGSLIPGTSVWANFSRDTVIWLYAVGNRIDLEPPKITAVDPTNLSSRLGQPYPDGSSRFPVDQPITSTWTKSMSIKSMITGPDSYGPATIGLRAQEIAKDGSGIGSPAFTVEPVLVDGDTRTRMVMTHRIFLTANDLGWTPLDANPSLPVYIPVFKSRLQDTRQNCFYPSEAINCSGIGEISPFCCSDSVSASALPACNPSLP